MSFVWYNPAHRRIDIQKHHALHLRFLFEPVALRFLRWTGCRVSLKHFFHGLSRTCHPSFIVPQSDELYLRGNQNTDRTIRRKMHGMFSSLAKPFSEVSKSPSVNVITELVAREIEDVTPLNRHERWRLLLLLTSEAQASRRLKSTVLSVIFFIMV